MTTAPSLKEQLIDAMAPRFDRNLAESVFTHDLWPVLEQAMANGELILARNTVQQRPVADSIISWLHAAHYSCGRVLSEQHIVSRNQLIQFVVDLNTSITNAIKDVEKIST